MTDCFKLCSSESVLCTCLPEKQYPITGAEMEKIFGTCGEHQYYDPHYHCPNCGGPCGMMGHWDLEEDAPSCQPRAKVSDYGLDP